MLILCAEEIRNVKYLWMGSLFDEATNGMFTPTHSPFRYLTEIMKMKKEKRKRRRKKKNRRKRKESRREFKINWFCRRG